MKITIETDNQAELDQLMRWLEEHNFLEKIQIAKPEKPQLPNIQRGDKSVDPRGLEGMWKDNPRTLEGIRKAAWGDRL
ncbi:hypothetical protein [Fibrella aquatilis]|uniref:Uncharacterized protein n=1 Tax=Fibrella aquatilis TaxID=2817059 RepID=A0A939JYK8_9BACT|nr:hypothetical protein [Fibrella aquatilis]MBO0932199.1 hypothetical protein [Fibrella aquatilis]